MEAAASARAALLARPLTAPNSARCSRGVSASNSTLLMRAVADVRARGGRRGGQAVAHHEALARARPDQAGQHAQRARLACCARAHAARRPMRTHSCSYHAPQTLPMFSQRGHKECKGVTALPHSILTMSRKYTGRPADAQIACRARTHARLFIVRCRRFRGARLRRCGRAARTGTPAGSRPGAARATGPARQSSSRTPARGGGGPC